jgi:hypothetical protein
MAEWVTTAAAVSILLVFQIIILVKIASVGRDQREVVRTLNLLMDTVEFQTESISKKIDKEPVAESPEKPSMIAYQKPTLREDGPARQQPPPPPPPPAKLKRW